MSDEITVEFSDNPAFNQWLIENYLVEIEEFEFPSSDVLYKMSPEKYYEALARYNADPKVHLSRIEDKFPNPIAFYFHQATCNYQNDHHRLDLLKSCWESIVFFLFGLVVGEARHRSINLKALGIKWATCCSNRLYDKLSIIENILDYAVKSGITFGCSDIIPISTIGLIKKLNQERNGFEHASAKTSSQQQALYAELYPQLEQVLRQLIKLEDVIVFRVYGAETPLYPRCEILNGCDLSGKKEIVRIQKDNYMEIVDYFNPGYIYAKVNDEVFCLAPFIHFTQEVYETNAILCFYKQDKGGKHQYEVVGKSQIKGFEKSTFDVMENQLRSLVK
ncbi:MAG TPA: hypothetical protein DCY35_10645 [Prolixibacteraceae bacterium]|nr:hypothetical protein [Prolixibacteraceae bacterium]